ncbi:MAG: cytochrome c [Acidobacteriia bacterium]|nr:cytochrome c [Terriglobia bacterium]
MNRTMKLAAIMIAAALVIGLAAPAFAEDVAALYKSKCAVCHGPDGKGDTAMGKKLGIKSFSSPEVAKKTDAELIEITTKGKDKMPSYDKKLTADQIKELVKYIRSLK